MTEQLSNYTQVQSTWSKMGGISTTQVMNANIFNLCCFKGSFPKCFYFFQGFALGGLHRKVSAVMEQLAKYFKIYR